MSLAFPAAVASGLPLKLEVARRDRPQMKGEAQKRGRFPAFQPAAACDRSQKAAETQSRRVLVGWSDSAIPEPVMHASRKRRAALMLKAEPDRRHIARTICRPGLLRLQRSAQSRSSNAGDRRGSAKSPRPWALFFFVSPVIRLSRPSSSIPRSQPFGDKADDRLSPIRLFTEANSRLGEQPQKKFRNVGVKYQFTFLFDRRRKALQRIHAVMSGSEPVGEEADESRLRRWIEHIRVAAMDDLCPLARQIANGPGFPSALLCRPGGMVRPIGSSVDPSICRFLES